MLPRAPRAGSALAEQVLGQSERAIERMEQAYEVIGEDEPDGTSHS